MKQGFYHPKRVVEKRKTKAKGLEKDKRIRDCRERRKTVSMEITGRSKENEDFFSHLAIVLSFLWMQKSTRKSSLIFNVF